MFGEDGRILPAPVRPAQERAVRVGSAEPGVSGTGRGKAVRWARHAAPMDLPHAVHGMNLPLPSDPRREETLAGESERRQTATLRPPVCKGMAARLSRAEVPGKLGIHGVSRRSRWSST